ncbi:MAG: hypothetical protein ACAI35_22550 [Candidatus Methylacidiphilales bacterium]|nr:hypothetical protein [Candidatus Methylacidiphilales bacterium]
MIGLCVLPAFAGDELPKRITPQQALEQNGSFTVSDGSSYFTFAGKGVFKSGPMSISGRTMRGFWEMDKDDRYVVTVRLGWVNGSSTGNDYRRIVFRLSSSFTKRENKPGFGDSPPVICDGYFYIDELVKINKPARNIPSDF